jgi:hypothetical protein
MAAPAPHYYNYYNAGAQATGIATPAALSLPTKNEASGARAKRFKKDPDAPKRPMSAFLDYSKTFRSEVIRNNPHVTDNKEISKILGALWRGASDAERHPFVEKELKARLEYKESIAQWRKLRNQEKKQNHSAGAAKPPQQQPRPKKSSKVNDSSTARNNNLVASSSPAAPPVSDTYTPSNPPVASDWKVTTVSEPAPAARDPSANYYGYPVHSDTAHHHGVDFSSYAPYTTPNSVNNNWSPPETSMYSPVNLNTVPPQDARYDYDRRQHHHPMPGFYPPQPFYYPQMHPSHNSGENMFSYNASGTLNDQQYFHDAYATHPHPQHRAL